ncbi:MAG: DNA polymerase I [Planctomycetales bacterium]|nr:DNA polymerase I [Planctomycetales bacterium]
MVDADRVNNAAGTMLKKLILLDGMALTYRAHFALIRSPRFTSGGICTSAVFGVLNTLLDIIKREEPTHIAVAFDTREPTSRHQKFPAYKAQRDAMPEDIAQQLPYIDRLFNAFNIQAIRMPGYEADDIIGTLAQEAAREGFYTLMVTPDKDYDQLVSEDILVMRPGRKGSEVELLGVPQVLAKWEVERVEQVIDVLGLMGDASDNIPGVPGIGPKTAQKLIAKYGSLENLLAHSHELKGKQRERLEENVEQARLSKWLVTIQRDVPHDIDLYALQWNGQDDKKLKALLAELEFDTLGKRFFGKSFSSAQNRATVVREKREKEIQASLFDDLPDERTLQDVPHQYHILRTADERQQLIEQLLQQPEICFDTETTGLDPRQALPLGIAFSFKRHEAYYVVCPLDPQQAQSVLDEFRPIFENEDIAKVGHNLKYDISLLKWHGLEVRGRLLDTMLAHSMKEPEMRHGLDYLAKLYLNYKPVATAELIGERGAEQKNMADVPLEQLAEYAAEDADVTLQVAQVLRPDIQQQGISQVCDEVECPLIPVLVDMEYEGIRLDSEALARYSLKLASEIEQLRESIFAVVGHEFNIDSPKQLGVVLYEELQLEKNPKKTATGQYSTRESELQRLASRHQIIADILDYRNAVKLKSVYVDQLPAAVNPQTGRLHTHYSQTWTATGRMQSNDPNLQTIPVRKQRGREIRAAFVPRDENYRILSADYSQIELRVMAHLSGDEAMLEAFRNQIDIHTATAAKVYKVAVEEVTREMRDKAKTVNFGIIYGISAFGLQQRLNIPRGEANELIANYFEKYPRVQQYIDRTIAFAREHGYVQTQTGRRRFLRDINSQSRGVASAAERLAMNSPIQGTAADILKLAMIRVHGALREGNFQTKMLLTVHDEIVFDLHHAEQDTVLPVIRTAMENALPLNVPLVVETGIGQNWLEAH